MWVFVTKILSVLGNFGLMVGNQIKAAWIQARAIVLAGVALLARYWGARIAWRVAMATLYIGLMYAATSAFLNFAVPDMSDILTLFAPSSVTQRREGIFHAFWDGGLNLSAFFAMLRRVVAALVTAWTARKAWALFLVRRVINPPL